MYKNESDPDLTVTFSGLQPGVRYEILGATLSGYEVSETITWVGTTGENKVSSSFFPEPVWFVQNGNVRREPRLPMF